MPGYYDALTVCCVTNNNSWTLKQCNIIVKCISMGGIFPEARFNSASIFTQGVMDGTSGNAIFKCFRMPFSPR